MCNVCNKSHKSYWLYYVKDISSYLVKIHTFYLRNFYNDMIYESTGFGSIDYKTVDFYFQQT
jgi:hypothetical protein